MTSLRFVVVLVLTLLAAGNSIAQERIRFEDVVKFELTNYPGGFFNEPSTFHKFEVVKVNGNWINNEVSRSGEKTFLANIGSDVVDALLKFMHATDTTIHFDQFKLSDEETAFAFDSLNRKDNLEITPSQRTVFLKAFKKGLPDRLVAKLHEPEFYADRTRYTIIVFTKMANLGIYRLCGETFIIYHGGLMADQSIIPK